MRSTTSTILSLNVLEIKVMSLVLLRNYDLSQDGEYVFKAISNLSTLHPMIDKYNLYQKDIDSFQNVFTQKLNNNIKLFKTIISNNEFCGFIMSYDYKFNDQHIKIYTCLPNDNWNELGEPLYRSYLNILFSYYNLRKVYIETTSINESEINFLNKFGFTKELTLHNYYNNNGLIFNKLFYSIGYDLFYEKYQLNTNNII